ncbi:unnamed protein product [Eruca vesicaria subsp. sativa]|uniref:Single-stranded DNA binding protein Ssb-like OB fold domain-containing protein n=1 Tax=Eruca vesicaria subsp. sativa TaxID=29727 RepID=A0ABC8M055_ERUVS|nr:unnamed protein product [Eruca vesicaria subsp. sativa]
MSSAPTSSNTTDNSQQKPQERNGPPPRRRQGRNPPPPTRTRYQQTTQGGTQEKKKPVFVKVDQLKPGTSGHTLTVKVVEQNSVPQKPGVASSHQRPVRIAECLVGDETASILFTARNDQVGLMKVGTTVNLRNAKIDMFKGSMRLAVDKWGRIEVIEPADIAVRVDNNLSLVEYELVNVEG